LTTNNKSPIRAAEDAAQAVLESIEQLAFEAVHRYAANLTRISAMARAIARGDVPQTDVEALAATLRQLSEHCEYEVREHIRALQIMRCGRQHSSESDDDSGPLFPVDAMSLAIH